MSLAQLKCDARSNKARLLNVEQALAQLNNSGVTGLADAQVVGTTLVITRFDNTTVNVPLGAGGVVDLSTLTNAQMLAIGEAIQGDTACDLSGNVLGHLLK